MTAFTRGVTRVIGIVVMIHEALTSSYFIRFHSMALLHMRNTRYDIESIVEYLVIRYIRYLMSLLKQD